MTNQSTDNENNPNNKILTTSQNRMIDWIQTCRQFQFPLNSDSNSSHVTDLTPPVINLLPSPAASAGTYESQWDSDGFMKTSKDLKCSIDEMSRLLQKELTQMQQKEKNLSEDIICNRLDPNGNLNGRNYNMNNHNIASVMELETNVASFAVRTANEIERLRCSMMARNATLEDWNNEEGDGHRSLFYVDKYNRSVSDHRAGIIACLLACLREDVASVLSVMQRERRQREERIRDEVKRNQMRVGNVSMPDEKGGGAVIGEVMSSHGTKNSVAHHMELETEGNGGSLRSKNISNDDKSITDYHLGGFSQNDINLVREQQNHGDDLTYRHHTSEDQQHPVSMMEQMQVQEQKESTALSDMMAVEQKMMEITTLLNQFSNLVSEQQDDVIAVYENTSETKNNMEKGQEQLVSAKNRAKSSKHYMATFILVMSILLLLMNWLLP